MAVIQILSCWLCATALQGTAGQSPALPADRQARLEALIRQLGDSCFAKRDAATKALLSEDETIVPLLDRVRQGADLELQRRIDRIRYALVGYVEDLTSILRAAPEDIDPGPNARRELLLFADPFRPQPPWPSSEAKALVAAHQPKSGDFLLRIIADRAHELHRPATRLFCET